MSNFTVDTKSAVCLLGATGSIGDSTIDVLKHHSDRFTLHSVAAGSNWQKMAAIAREFDVKHLVMWSSEAAEKLSKELGREVLCGMDGLLQIVKDPEVDVVMNGLVGSVGCLPTLEAIKHDKRVALANKETLVMAGYCVEQLLSEHPKASLLPVDSEHNAIFQCLAERPTNEVHHIQLTASGGPFRTLPKEEFANITRAQALKHPTWSMGPKITIDSSTLMNKGLEVMEAHYLFKLPYDQIKVVVHPQSIVHSMVQFVDGSLMAQLGAPDMRHPIQFALSYPERWDLNVDHVYLPDIGSLDFFAPDTEKFPCLRLAYEAGNREGTAPAILNAANEVVVPAFLDGQIEYVDIPKILEDILGKSSVIDEPDLDTILKVDQETRVFTLDYLKSKF